MKSIEVITVFCLCAFWTHQVSSRHHTGHHRHGNLLGCSRCPPGHMVVQHCTIEMDTKCQPCGSGTYLPHHSIRRTCYVCSRCGDGLYMAHPCLPWSDTVCDSCHTSKGPHNADYIQRCLKRAKYQREYDEDKSMELETIQPSTQISKRILTKDVKIVSPNRTKVTEIVTTLAVSASCSAFIFFVILAAIYAFKWRKNTIQKNYLYSAVELNETVML